MGFGDDLGVFDVCDFVLSWVRSVPCILTHFLCQYIIAPLYCSLLVVQLALGNLHRKCRPRTAYGDPDEPLLFFDATDCLLHEEDDELLSRDSFYDCTFSFEQQSADELFCDCRELLYHDWQDLPAHEKAKMMMRFHQRSRVSKPRMHATTINKRAHEWKRQRRSSSIARSDKPWSRQPLVPCVTADQTLAHAAVAAKTLDVTSTCSRFDGQACCSHALGDGNCLWRSVGKATGLQWKRLKRHCLRMKGSACPDIQEHAKQLRCYGMWADNLAIVMAAQYLKAAIDIVDLDQKVIIHFSHVQHTRNISIALRNGHFMPACIMHGEDGCHMDMKHVCAGAGSCDDDDEIDHDHHDGECEQTHEHHCEDAHERHENVGCDDPSQEQEDPTIEFTPPGEHTCYVTIMGKVGPWRLRMRPVDDYWRFCVNRGSDWYDIANHMRLVKHCRIDQVRFTCPENGTIIRHCNLIHDDTIADVYIHRDTGRSRSRSRPVVSTSRASERRGCDGTVSPTIPYRGSQGATDAMQSPRCFTRRLRHPLPLTLMEIVPL